MEMLDAFYQPNVIDSYTFVFDEQEPRTNLYTVLATDRDGVMFSQWTEGFFDPNGTNDHLGRHVIFGYVGKQLINHVLDRMEAA